MISRSFFFVLFFLVYGCAQQRSPTGGPRDTTPPKVLMADPLPMSTGFNTQKIEITFDEFVQLQGLRDQVLISPPLENEPEISLKNGKKLIIDFGEQQLLENTTYTINLGNAIVDNNEENVLEENVYLFSTGDFIDSLEIRGQLLKARFNDPCASCMAFLFPDVPDSSVIVSRPLFVAKADEEGYFHLTNLASGAYRLMAVEDLNADLKINEDETFAFMNELIFPQVSDSIAKVLWLSRPYAPEPQISFSEWALDGTYLTIKYEGVDTLAGVRGSAAPQISFIEYLNDTQDSLRFWFSNPLDEESDLIFDIGDESDTLTLGRVSERNEEYELMMFADLADQEAKLELQFNSPIASFDTSKFQIIRDSVPLSFRYNEKLPSLGIWIESEWLPGNYSITLLPGALTNIYGVQNDTIHSSVKCQSPESFGILTLNVDVPDSSNFRFELLDKSREIVRSTSSKSKFTWTISYLRADTYTLRVFRDDDRDGLWTEGDFEKKNQPEPVFMLADPITVRANWEMEQEVNVVFRP